MHTIFHQSLDALAEQLRHCVVDADSFLQPLVPCQLGVCKATCCHDGVTLSSQDAEVLEKFVTDRQGDLANLGFDLPPNGIIEHVSGGKCKTRTRAAEINDLADDYPAHFPNTKCLFLDPQNRCYLQRLAYDEGIHPWSYKPITCWLHPVVILPAGRDSARATLKLHQVDKDPQTQPGYPGFATFTHCGRRDDCGKVAHEVLAGELAALSSLVSRDFVSEITAPADCDWY
ncbi:hypothetical protein [Persicirhabdus sediminis]|uniref:Uncharacterized protein n=1 Tax=Persicirhabdus sediminis TaxID=454144 RepID=A0A8J7SNB8_9BACT|nr:hypothetical protein [Persicirhabdus sediminis]MBK1792610.1 hypothetical protein [Persicirhabdus sediminis]